MKFDSKFSSYPVYYYLVVIIPVMCYVATATE